MITFFYIECLNLMIILQKFWYSSNKFELVLHNNYFEDSTKLFSDLYIWIFKYFNAQFFSCIKLLFYLDYTDL